MSKADRLDGPIMIVEPVEKAPQLSRDDVKALVAIAEATNTLKPFTEHPNFPTSQIIGAPPIFVHEPDSTVWYAISSRTRRRGERSRGGSSRRRDRVVEGRVSIIAHDSNHRNNFPNCDFEIIFGRDYRFSEVRMTGMGSDPIDKLSKPAPKNSAPRRRRGVEYRIPNERGWKILTQAVEAARQALPSQR